MFRSFKWKLVLAFIVPILVLVFTIGFAMVRVVDQFYLQQVEEQLTNEAQLIADQTRALEYSERSKELKTITAQAAKQSHSRVTVVAPNGMVMADSEEDPAKMENHATRPEVRAALSGKTGSITRDSSTLHMRMKYVAVPVTKDGQVIGVVRISLPLKSIDELLFRLWWIIFVVMALAAIVAALISYRIASRLAEPITHITQVAESIADGNLNGRVYYQDTDEIGILADAMNTMAQKIESHINEISEIKARLESVLENTVNGVILMGPDSHILLINKKACEMFAVDEPSATDRHQLEITHSYAINDALEQTTREKQPVHTECTLHIMGEKTVQIHTIPVFKENAGIESLLLIINDVTELKRLETIRKDFVANVSHELRTPMTSISGFAETLMNENADNETVYEFSRIIHDEAGRLSRMVNSLLELSRIEASNPELKLTRFSVQNLITNTIAKLEQQIDNKHITVELRLTHLDLEVEADRDRIEQVVINILDNAITHSPEHGRISIYVQAEPNELKVTISDEGPGIPAGEEKRIFERFYRIDKSRARKDGGSGLGLSIARNIVEVHKGTIGVENTRSGGASFYFTLPLS
ncbi:MAG: ATP-binding protein [Acidobacteriota bacterium]